MRDPRNALRPFAAKETHAARERLAEQAFNLETARKAVIEAAARGEGRARLSLGDAQADLSQTEAAKALREWAAGSGFTLTWQDTLTARPNGLRVLLREPVIEWEPEREPSG